MRLDAPVPAPMPYSIVVSAGNVAVIAVLSIPAFELLSEMREGVTTTLVANVVNVVVCWVGTRWALGLRSQPRMIFGLAAVVLAAGGLPLLPWIVRVGADVSWLMLGLTVVANMLAGPALWAAYTMLLAVAIWPCIAHASHEGADRAAILAAAWVALRAVLLFVAMRVLPMRPDHAVLTLGIAIPAGAGVVAFTRAFLRRRWLASVRAGRDPGWRLVDARGISHDELPAITHARRKDQGYEVLARLHPAQSGFRGSEWLEPVACVAHGARTVETP
jgi:hypothetical protein